MRKCKQVNVARCDKHQAAQVCEERAGPTPSQGPEGTQPGRATAQRQGYWGDDSLGDEVNAPGQQLARRGAVAARRAHNPKVDGSNPSAATKSKNAGGCLNKQPPAFCVKALGAGSGHPVVATTLIRVCAELDDW